MSRTARQWRPIQLPQQQRHRFVKVGTVEVSDPEMAAQLAGMVRRCTDRWHRAGHALDPDTADRIIAGLRPCATVGCRRAALEAIAAEVDWPGTPEGSREVAALVAWIAPDCTTAVWQRITEEVEQATDSTLDYMAHRAAEGNLLAALAEAVPAQTTHAPTGPEAA